jgi:hypothetical protein
MREATLGEWGRGWKNGKERGVCDFRAFGVPSMVALFYKLETCDYQKYMGCFISLGAIKENLSWNHQYSPIETDSSSE